MLSQLGGHAVARWRAKLLREVFKLEFDPLCYPFIEESVDLGLSYRETIFGNRRHIYRVIYSVDESASTVFVHHIRHASQDRLTPDDL